MGKKDKSQVTIRGFVVALDWDEEDRPLSVAIQTEDWLEVLVEDSGSGAELLELEDAEVEVHGVLDESDSDNPSIAVKSFEVLEDPDAEPEEEEQEVELDEELSDDEDDDFEADDLPDDDYEDDDGDFDEDEDDD